MWVQRNEAIAGGLPTTRTLDLGPIIIIEETPGAFSLSFPVFLAGVPFLQRQKYNLKILHFSVEWCPSVNSTVPIKQQAPKHSARYHKKVSTNLCWLNWAKEGCRATDSSAAFHFLPLKTINCDCPTVNNIHHFLSKSIIPPSIQQSIPTMAAPLSAHAARALEQVKMVGRPWIMVSCIPHANSCLRAYLCSMELPISLKTNGSKLMA